MNNTTHNRSNNRTFTQYLLGSIARDMTIAVVRMVMGEDRELLIHSVPCAVWRGHDDEVRSITAASCWEAHVRQQNGEGLQSPEVTVSTATMGRERFRLSGSSELTSLIEQMTPNGVWCRLAMVKGSSTQARRTEVHQLNAQQWIPLDENKFLSVPTGVSDEGMEFAMLHPTALKVILLSGVHGGIDMGTFSIEDGRHDSDVQQIIGEAQDFRSRQMQRRGQRGGFDTKRFVAALKDKADPASIAALESLSPDKIAAAVKAAANRRR